MTSTTTKERPILFSAPMVRAILDGRKTMTRRIVKPQPPSIAQVTQQAGIGFSIFTDEHTPGEFRVAGPVWCVRESMGREPKWKCPCGVSGDRLWVRETFLPCTRSHVVKTSAATYACFVDGSQKFTSGEYFQDSKDPSACVWPLNARWKPSIHMPRWASRITLQVEAVRVERLQDITEADAIAEGFADCRDDPDKFSIPGPLYRFESLWKQLNGDGSWNVNPWVWVVSFGVVNHDADGVRS